MQKGRTYMTQKDRVLNYIKENGSIDRLRAFTDCGVFELSSIIVNLEKRGYRFRKEQMLGITKFGESFHYKKYSLVKEPDHE